MSNFGFMNNMFGNIQPGMCKLSMKGDIAIKTSQGYKTYDAKTGRAVNCNNFVFGSGTENFFFMIPTSHPKTGDIILAGGKPHCVIEVKDNEIKTFCYEDSTISTIVPERHIFMGKTYFYGKIVCLFGDMKGKGAKNIMKMMLMSQMLNADGHSNAKLMPDNNVFGSNNTMMMLMMMNGGIGNMFDDMFDFDMDVVDTEDEEEVAE